MDYQIRIRTDELFENMEYIKQWLALAETGFAFNHKLPDNNHYHIYLFGLDKDDQVMRRHLFKYLPSKECYSVSKTAGKDRKPISLDIAYQYAKKPKSNPVRVWTKNITAEDLERLELKADVFYNKKSSTPACSPVSEILVIEKQESKPDRVWERLIDEYLYKPEIYEGLTVAQIKSRIAVGYLRQMKAVPRPSDLHRYAISLYYMTKYGVMKSNEDIPMDALVAEYNH